MVPKELRAKILSAAHDKPFSGHMGTRRTLYRLTQSFYWPGVSRDVTKYCKSCEVCLKTKPKGKTPKAPLQISPVFDRPFFKCAIDLIGPLLFTLLLLLSDSVSKFSSSWKGPFEIVQVVPNSDVNYVVRVNGMDKTIHVDMLQEFVHRPAELMPETIDVNAKEGKEQTDEPLQVSAAVVMGASSMALINSFSPAFASMIHEEHDSQI